MRKRILRGWIKSVHICYRRPLLKLRVFLVSKRTRRNGFLVVSIAFTLFQSGSDTFSGRSI